MNTPSETPPSPKLAVAAELAWAKTRFPKELGTFEITPHGAELLAWVAPTTKLPVFVTSSAGRCKPGVLERDDADRMELVLYTDERTVGRDRIRQFTRGDVGDELNLGGLGGSEKQQKDGTWLEHETWGVSEQSSWGHLSKVTQDYARFGGTWVDLAASCKGAITNLQCTNGATIECNACTDVAVTVATRPMGMMGRTVVAPSISIGCPTCAVTSNADLDRMAALLPELNGWTVDGKRTAPTIYKRKSDCMKGI